MCSLKAPAEMPITSVQPFWRLVKDGHVVEARVRPIDGIGVELRELLSRVEVLDRTTQNRSRCPAE